MNNVNEGVIQRSFLFVPGNRPERFVKALDSGADAIIIDLEDAVAAEEKATARTALMQTAFSRSNVLVYVRINAVDTAWFADDLKVLRHAGICGVFLPKAGVFPANPQKRFLNRPLFWRIVKIARGRLTAGGQPEYNRHKLNWSGTTRRSNGRGAAGQQ